MTKHLQILVLAVLGQLLLQFSHFYAAIAHTTLPSGRVISSEEVQKLPVIAASKEDHSTSLYEIVGDKLVGKSHNIDVSQSSYTYQLYVPKVTVNGVHVKPSPGQLRSSGGYDVIYGPSGNVVGVLGPSISIIPLSKTMYPGIYINVHHDIQHRGKNVETVASETRRDLKLTNSNRSAQFVSSDSCEKRTAVRYMDLALSSDNSFCERQGNNIHDAVAEATARVVAANVPFARQTCIRLRLQSLELHCSNGKDPYARMRYLESGPLLEAFQKNWEVHHADIVRDAAIFVPGYYSETFVRGEAYNSGGCSYLRGYAWAEMMDPFVIAHEVGHLLSCPHSEDGGLMSAVAGVGEPLIFSPLSIQCIQDFVDKDPQSACLRTLSETPSCRSGFSKWNALLCFGTFLGHMHIDGMRSESKVTISFNQDHGQFHIDLRGDINAHISRAAVLLTTRETIDWGKLDQFRSFSGTVTHATFTFDMASVGKEIWQVTCCNKALKVIINIRICEHAVALKCKDGLFKTQTVVKCYSCPRPSSFTPMSPSKMCSSCTARNMSTT